MKYSEIYSAIKAVTNPLLALQEEVSVAMEDIAAYTKCHLNNTASSTSLWVIVKEMTSVVFGTGISSLVMAAAMACTNLKGGAAIMAALKLIGFGTSALLGIGILGIIGIGGYIATKNLFQAMEDDAFRAKVSTALTHLYHTLSDATSIFSFCVPKLSTAKPYGDIFNIQLAAAKVLSVFKVDLSEVVRSDVCVEIGDDILSQVKHSGEVNTAMQAVYTRTRDVISTVTWEEVSSTISDKELIRFSMAVPNLRGEFRRKQFDQIRSTLENCYIDNNFN